jgi:hypothetical protein
LVCGAAAPHASAQLTIHLTFDSSVTSNPNSAAIQAAVTYAAQQIESHYSDAITININVVAAPGTSILGQSTWIYQYPYTYAQIRSFLTSHASTPDDTTAVASLGATDPTSGGNFGLPLPQAKALGQRAANDPGNDGTFTFGAGNNFTFDPAHRAVAGKIDFIGVAEHELSEIMGRVAGLNSGGIYIIHDLFRYSAPGVRRLAAGGNAYFSINGGTTNLRGYNNLSSGDPSDWDSTIADAFNAFVGAGVENDMSATDLRLMDVLGYHFIASSVCYANCDGSTVAPILNINDYQCFINKFAAGDSYANCDGSTSPPILNVNDFQCFVNKFAAGCS